MPLRSALVLATLVAASCASKPAPAPAMCSATSCTAMHERCYVSLPDEPDYAWCVSNTQAPDGGVFPADPDSCLQVCEADQEATFIQCLSDNAAVCSPAGAPSSLVGSCQSAQQAAAPSPSAHCDNGCQVARAACQGACPLTSFDDCYQCSLACSLTAITCRKACPVEPPHCTNGVKDGNETDGDCGGDCGPCAEGRACNVAADCVGGNNCVNGRCAAVLACAKLNDCPEETCLNGTCR